MDGVEEKKVVSGQRSEGVMGKVERLARLARGEEVPAIGVDMEMLLRSEAKGTTSSMIFPMAWAAGVAAVAACLLMVLALRLTTAAVATTTSTSGGSIGQVNSDPLLSAVKVEMP